MNLHADAQFIPRVDKWFDLHKNPDNINADYKDKYDATMYSSLVLSVVLTSSLFFIFKKL